MAESWPQRSFSLFIFCQKEKFGLEGESLRLLDGFIYKGDSKREGKEKKKNTVLENSRKSLIFTTLRA